MKLDSIDKKILLLLQENGRMSNVELSRHVDLSPPPCLRRLKFLENSGIITGYKALLDYQKLGYAVKAIIVVKVSSQRTNAIKAFCENLKNLPFIISCYSTIGNTEFIISVIAKDLEEYTQFLHSYLQNNSEITSFSSFIISNTYKSIEFTRSDVSL